MECIDYDNLLVRDRENQHKVIRKRNIQSPMACHVANDRKPFHITQVQSLYDSLDEVHM